MTDALDALLAAAPSPEARLVVLTGAGISAESGIPTFRGPEGYWRVGSVNYRPEELATHAAFEEMPDEIWRWYRMRLDTCRRAAPNAAHLALVRLEQALGDAFLLVTQNVDGLHARAGQGRARTFAIHGELELMRCDDEACPASETPVPLPETPVPVPDVPEPAALRCARCGSRMRPHVLWFDESYDEARFRYESTLSAMRTACALVVIGTSGATTLPSRAVDTALRREIPLVVVDPEETVFARAAARAPHGVHLVGSATERVPELVARLVAARAAPRHQN